MKTLKIIGISLLVLFAGIAGYLYTSGPTLPDNTEAVIQEVISHPLPEMVQGETGFAQSKNINIWYESLAPKGTSKGAVLLVMGISNDALGWPPNFLRAFVDAGYQVIRYDHRGTGMSDWMKDWDSDHAYSLADMADDGVAVLDQLGIQKAHVIGISMGGMIAQELAINHPQRINSLSSIMSSGYITDPELPKISGEIAKELIKVSLKYGIVGGEKNMIKLHLASRMILMGETTHPLNVKSLSEQVLYNVRKRKGYNPGVSKQHQAAVWLSGSRYEKLKTLRVPTLIVHGKSDPFIPFEHGKKCAFLIPGADTLWIADMGHDIPEEMIKPIAERIMENFNR